MSLKIPYGLFIKLEGQKLINKIDTEFGLHMDYKKGNNLVLYHGDMQILNLASDTLEFWTSKQATSVDNICILENKKVVWKFHDDYARKVVHLFEDDLRNLGNAEVKMNNKLKKNVSTVEIFCEYEHFKTVEPTVENISRGAEGLNHKQIKVKQSDKIKAKKFVEDKLDNDKSVLCFYHEKEKALDIFAKNKDSIAKVEKEFNQGPLKMTDRGPKDTATTAIKTTVLQTTASSFTEPRLSVTEPKDNHSSSFVETKSTLSQSTSIPKQPSMRGADADLKDSLTTSVRNPKMTDVKPLASTYTTSKSPNLPPKDVPKSDMTISSNVMSKNYSTGVYIGSGSNFKYEFELDALKVFVYKQSIVEVKDVDAIVNAANEHMVHGGGVAYYISKAAGKTMDDESRAYVARHGKVQVGEICVTRAGRLPYKGIIHAVGPQWSDYIGIEDRCAKDLYHTIRNILKAAEEMKWKRIALCAVSAGIYGVPKEVCAEMYVKALANFSEDGPGSLSEVHFVDVSLEILGLVKDAHEKWCRSPDSIDFKNAYNYPSSTGRKYASNAAHSQVRSYQQSMNESSLVNFVGQSKTRFDDSPVFEFKICGAMKVKVYTGDLVKLDCVDAIVCAVDENFTGGLVNAVAKAGGQTYKKDLMYASRRTKSSSEGEIIICSGGALRVRKVMHIRVINPVLIVSDGALARLKLFNQKILEEANHNMYRRFGMPLIGAGLLKNKDDIEACSQRFAKDVLEFCRNNRTKLRLEELHVVNQDANRTLLLRGAFLKLENQIPTTSLAAVDNKERSIRGTSERWETEDKKGGIKQSSLLERTTKETKPQNLMAPLDSKGIRCTYFGTCEKNAEWSMKCGHVFCSVCKVPLEGMEKCLECVMKVRTGAPEKDTKGTKEIKPSGEETEETCPVCLSEFTEPVDLPCSHRLCKQCLDQLKQHKPCCPICNAAFGVITGTQPNGTMNYRELKDSLPGFESCNSIQIIYDFPDGIQRKEHPKPGRPYRGTQRHAFLPNNREGKTVLKLLEVAFKRRLIFTIGDSRTTGKEDRVTWNDIHHKTAKFGGSENFGYPDPDYLARVKDELAAKGVTEDSLT